MVGKMFCFVLINVSFKNYKAQLPLLVAGGVGDSLLGRNWFEKLGITLHGLNNLMGTTIDATLGKFSVVFNEALTGFQGHLHALTLMKT